MPSSRLLVATTQGRSPRLSASSVRLRCSRLTLPWWARAISIGGAVRRPALVGDLVEPVGQPLGEAAGVGEHDGAVVGLDQVDDPALDRGPDARLAVAELGHVLDRHDDLDLDRLGRRRGDDGHVLLPAEEPGHLIDRSHGRRQPDALGRPVEQGVEALEAQREVGAALAAGHRVDLVDDHGLDAAQRLAGLAGEDQEQRLGRGDQDVGRRAHERAALLGRGVAGAHRDRDVADGDARAGPRHGAMPVERRAQVAVHVDGERLERADVEDPAALGRLGRPRRGHQPVDRVQERGEGLARAGRGDDQRVVPVGDRVPRAALGGGRRGEGRA